MSEGMLKQRVKSGILQALRQKNPITAGDLFRKIQPVVKCGYTTFYEAMRELETELLIRREKVWLRRPCKGITSKIYLANSPSLAEIIQAIRNLNSEMEYIRKFVSRQMHRWFNLEARIARIEKLVRGNSSPQGR